jgi:hypothetical protein
LPKGAVVKSNYRRGFTGRYIDITGQIVIKRDKYIISVIEFFQVTAEVFGSPGPAAFLFPY